jgi:hypothetical protein
MKEVEPETYILPVPGSEETQEVPRSVVLERIAKGELTPADWVWSPADQDWKTVAEIPSLQTALPAPKKSFLESLAPLTPKQKIEPIVAPVIGLPPVSTKKKKVKPKRTKPDDEDEPSRFGTVVSVLILALFAVVALNYQFIDRPFDGGLAQTRFVLVRAHAHLGAFFQRDTLVIHILPTSELDADNFADFLFTAASCTPPAPFGTTAFDVIELTPAWRGEYAFTGDDWRRLAKMTSSTSQDRKDFILAHIDDAGGEKLVPMAGLDATADKATQDRIWQNLAGSFHAEGSPAGGGIVSSLIAEISSLLPHGGESPTAPSSAGGSTNVPPAH